MRIIFLGAPGSGKGTQSQVIENEFHIVHISTGDMFRQAIKDNTPAGKVAADYINQGLLVPDEVTIKVVEERLMQDDCANGFLFDGFPRTIAQAEALDELLKKHALKLDSVIYLKVEEAALLERIEGRLVCPQCGAGYHKSAHPSKVEGICDVCGATLTKRKDDNAETMKVRCKTYNEQTAPLIDYYENKGLLRTVDALASIDEVSESIRKILK